MKHLIPTDDPDFVLPERYRSEQKEAKQKKAKQKEAKRLRKVHAARNESIRKDRLRIKWGLEQKTLLRLVGSPKGRQCRYALRKRGYHVERGGWEAYFDSSTTRSKIVERNAERHGIRILKWQN